MPTHTLQDKRSILSQHFLFSSFTDADLDKVLTLASEKNYRHKQEIFHKGQAGQSLIAVLEGRVKISISSAEGKEILLEVIEAGNIFGEIALIDGRERSADATAIGNSTLLLIRRQDFLGFLEQQPKLAVQLLTVLCKKLRDTNDTVERVGLLQAPARLASLILKLADTQGNTKSQPLRVTVPFSQGEIGNLIGTTRETVNRLFRSWQDDGLLQIDHQQITILQFNVLKDIAASIF